MLRHTLLILATAGLFFPSGAYAAQLNLDRHPPELEPAIEQKIAHYYPRHPRSHRRKRDKRPNKPNARIIINV
ncbi:MAG: hypothetical protein AAF383_20960 [Cyanobacteria bacterium P01_A01_bin.83]